MRVPLPLQLARTKCQPFTASPPVDSLAEGEEDEEDDKDGSTQTWKCSREMVERVAPFATSSSKSAVWKARPTLSGFCRDAD